jgi:hypothetical protein
MSPEAAQLCQMYFLMVFAKVRDREKEISKHGAQVGVVSNKRASGKSCGNVQGLAEREKGKKNKLKSEDFINEQI